MKEFVRSMDELPLIVKVILCLPFLDIIWGIYRLIKAIAVNDPLRIVIAVLLLVIGVPFIWLLDLIFVLFTGTAFWF